MATGAGAAAVAAAAVAAAQGYQLLVGGLLMEIPPEAFRDLVEKTRGMVLTGCTKTFWTGRPKRRFYFLPHNGITFYCRTEPDNVLPLSGVIEVPRLQLGPLGQYLEA